MTHMMYCCSMLALPPSIRASDFICFVKVMSAQEIKWVDSYHQEVLDKVSPRLQHLPEELNWLQCNTIPLQSHDNGVAAPKVRPAYMIS